MGVQTPEIWTKEEQVPYLDRYEEGEMGQVKTWCRAAGFCKDLKLR
jgi:hypothetical protein